MKILILFSLLLIVSEVKAESEWTTGLDLYEKCIIAEDSFNNKDASTYNEFLFCVSLVQGFRFGIDISYAFYHKSSEKIGICIPNEVSALQLVLTLNKFLRENPEELHKEQSYLIGRAFLDAYHCELAT